MYYNKLETLEDKLNKYLQRHKLVKLIQENSRNTHTKSHRANNWGNCSIQSQYKNVFYILGIKISNAIKKMVLSQWHQNNKIFKNQF